MILNWGTYCPGACRYSLVFCLASTFSEYLNNVPDNIKIIQRDCFPPFTFAIHYMIEQPIEYCI